MKFTEERLLEISRASKTNREFCDAVNAEILAHEIIKAKQDEFLFGSSYMLNGEHVPIQKVVIIAASDILQAVAVMMEAKIDGVWANKCGYDIRTMKIQKEW